MRRAFLHQMQVYGHAVRPHLETMQRKKKGNGGTFAKGDNTSNAPAVPGSADIRDSEGGGERRG